MVLIKNCKTWIETTSISITINENNQIIPKIGIECLFESEDKVNSFVAKFANWFTDNINEIFKIFPIFYELQEFILCLTTVKILRFMITI